MIWEDKYIDLSFKAHDTYPSRLQPLFKKDTDLSPSISSHSHRDRSTAFSVSLSKRGGRLRSSNSLYTWKEVSRRSGKTTEPVKAPRKEGIPTYNQSINQTRYLNSSSMCLAKNSHLLVRTIKLLHFLENSYF